MARLALVLLLLTVGGIAALYFTDYRFEITQDEAIQRDVRAHATGADLDKRINDAIGRDDIDDATMYSDIAASMGWPLSPSTDKRLKNATSTVASVVRNTGQFASGFVTGEGGTSMAGLAGAVTSDLTVVGDVRDIASEGTKMVEGKPYSELVLGLSVVGVAATAAVVATGGGGVVAKLGVSVLKVAKRAGTLTVDFARTLTRLTRDAVNTPELLRVLRGTNLRDVRATEEAITAYARGVRTAEIGPVLRRLEELSRNTSPSEAVRLLRYVHTTKDLDDVTVMSARLGKKTRGIVELTGKAALRLFKTSLNILEFLIEKILWLGGWLLTLLGMSATKRVFRGIRAAPSGGGLR
jgi:hypothetical protein